MYYSIFPTATTYISSGSNKDTGESQIDQNFGGSEVLELKKVFSNSLFESQTRILVKFDLNETGNSISQSIVNGDIPSPTVVGLSAAKYYLKLYETEGNKELSEEYTLAVLPLSESWQQGIGKSFDNPKTKEGCSWKYRSAATNASSVSWTQGGAGVANGGSVVGVSGSTKSFDRTTSADLDIDVSNMVKSMLRGGMENHGMQIRFSGSQETNETTFGHLNFFSKETNTVYAPKLEVRWDDHTAITGDNTGSLTQLTMSGADNLLYIKGLRDKYKETEKVRFRVGARKRYIQKTFSTSVQTDVGSYVPEKSGSYSIVDVSTNEAVIPFKDSEDRCYSYLSCNSDGMYFDQWLNTFYPGRVYKILLKLDMDDGQEIIYDDNWEFKVVN